MKRQFNQRGFTFAEIMVVIFIFVLMAALVLASFRTGERNSQFLLVIEQAASDIRKMQTQSLTGIIEEQIVASGGFGAYFDLSQPDRYVLFRDDGDQIYNVSGGDVVLETVFFPESISLNNLTATPLTIVFKPPKPSIYVNGGQVLNEIAITLADSFIDDKFGSVTVNRITGRVTAELIAGGAL